MITNSTSQYGSVSRALHWTIAVLIIIALVLGLIGDNTERSAETAEFLQRLYSVHKTIGITVLFLAIIRVAWAISQPKPAALHPDRTLETLAAETVHWALYAAMFVMPLSGWVMHAAETGFAPILWPFGQNLPFVPKSETVAHSAGFVHMLASYVLYASLAAHIVGALKHAIVDRDATLARMAHGKSAAPASGAKPAGWIHTVSAAATLAVFAAIIAIPFVTAKETSAAPAPMASAETAGEWQVQSGAIDFTVIQMGAQVTGQLPDWTANIDYDPATGVGQTEVTIDTSTLTLGSVTDQAKGAEFFDTSNYQTAVFTADISRVDGTAHVANGTLTLVGQTVPVALEFDLTVDGDQAQMTGSVTLDRRDFGMGAGYTDEGTVGFAVVVDVTVTATR